MSKLTELSQDLKTVEFGNISDSEHVVRKYVKNYDSLSFLVLQEARNIISGLISKEKSNLEYYINHLEKYRCWVIYCKQSCKLYEKWTGRGHIVIAFVSYSDAMLYLKTNVHETGDWEIRMWGEV